MRLHNTVLVATLLLLAVKEIHGGIKCYVCDTKNVDNYDPQVCDDPFLISRGATVESNCAACTKERTYTSGVMFVTRGCEKALRWESSIYSCSRAQREREYVATLPGTRCTCLTDLCNASAHTTYNALLLLFPLFMVGQLL